MGAVRNSGEQKQHVVSDGNYSLWSLLLGSSARGLTGAWCEAGADVGVGCMQNSCAFGAMVLVL